MATEYGQMPPVPTPPSEVMAISLSSRIPEFWMDQPRVWFIRVEAILAPQKMSDDSKFDLVISKLPKEVIVQITDFLARPPDTGKFQALKTKLLSLFEDSMARQIEKLIGEMELGEQKPSQLLSRMRELARDKIPDHTLRVLWQGHLPQTVRAVLAVSETKDLNNLAVIADNVAEASRTTHIAEVIQKPRGQKDSEDSQGINAISAELAKINIRLANIERDRSNSRRHGNRVRSARPRSRSRSRNPTASNWLCKYHWRFRHNAHRCIPPCAWKPKEAGENNTGIRTTSEN